MFDIRSSAIPGCVEIIPDVRTDTRGRFVKTMHAGFFAERHLDVPFREQFYSISRRHVLRGLHFQVPPHEHAKLVYCVSGAVLDVVLDLRVGSPTYGRHQFFELDETSAAVLYIPAGLAHGFLTVSDSAITIYNVTAEHSPEHDAGVHWASAGIPWPLTEPIVSERDARLTTFEDFSSPFVYEHPTRSPEALR